MITEKTSNCTFYNPEKEMCKIFCSKRFDCTNCLAFHTHEIVPHVEDIYADSYDEDEDI